MPLLIYRMAMVVGSVAMLACIVGLYILVHWTFVKFPASDLFDALQIMWRYRRKRGYITRALAYVLYQIKRGVNFATQDTKHAGVILSLPLTTLLAGRFLLQWGNEQAAWHKILLDAWDSLWFWAGIIALLILWISFLRKLPPLDEKFMRFCRKVVAIESILLIFSPWLLNVGEGLVQGMSRPSFSAVNLPSQNSSGEFPAGVAIKNGAVYATITGREEYGLTALQMPVESRYQICYEAGHISTYNAQNGKNEAQELWGNRRGYIQPGTAIDWSKNFRYASAPGALPQATLVVVGEIGSGHELVFSFPSAKKCMNVRNATTSVEPLNLYYHAMQSYWLANGNIIFPNPQVAAHYGYDKSAEQNGWLDQGKDGSTETFVIIPAES